jgi:L-ascorbate metabolism protein UlaG (beta-lactamase superfamily)
MSDSSVKVTRITHCCTLIDLGGEVLLTDPWFSERFAYHRGEALGLPLADLPDLAGVLVSHDHYDHNDMGAFSRYRDRSVPVYAEAAAARRARGSGFAKAAALNAWRRPASGTSPSPPCPPCMACPRSALSSRRAASPSTSAVTRC